MAGRPLRRAMIEALEKRTRALFEDDPAATHLDYVCFWLESGKTITQLSVELDIHHSYGDLSPAALQNYLRRTFDAATARMDEAREHSGEMHAEASLTISDEELDPEDRTAAQRQRNRIAARQWMAEKRNRKKFGQHVRVDQNVNVTSIHLDALRHRTIAPTVTGRVVAPDVPLLTGAEPARDAEAAHTRVSSETNVAD